ncbi:aspartate/glutamate racemase family protein [Rouxiella sp. S1S-2]|uniref:aspartate/glutamate racemase family protein n=1 Tax=Rouxiella sp. S1S-2 TaxID=2653856 RepID=UPI001D034A25|nr:aspartate/glutamate racemase family protein [Rouxiella sp. S1S-2]
MRTENQRISSLEQTLGYDSYSALSHAFTRIMSCCEQALTFSHSVGVIGIEPRAPEVFYEILHDKLRTYRKPKGVNRTHDIHTEAGKSAIIEAVLACEKEGAKVIALACTGMATTDVAALVAPHTTLPIINPVLAAGISVRKLLNS